MQRVAGLHGVVFARLVFGAMQFLIAFAASIPRPSARE